MRGDATHTASSINHQHHHRAADDDYAAISAPGHHRRLSSGRLSNVPSSGSLHSLLPPHRGRRRTCRCLLIALATILGLQLLAHALFPVASPLPAIAEGITSLSHSAALLAHTTHHLWDHPPMLAHTAHDHPSTTTIPQTLHLIGGATHPRGASDPTCALLGDGGWTVQRYTEAQAAAFVHREFLAHEPLYRSLAPWPAQRSTVFRMLVLLRHGGVALSADVDCHRSLDPVLSGGSLVVGWDADGRTIADALMASAPGHPVLRDAVQRLTTMAAHNTALEGPQALWEQWTAAVLTHSTSNLSDTVRPTLVCWPLLCVSNSNGTVGGACAAGCGAGAWS